MADILKHGGGIHTSIMEDSEIFTLNAMLTFLNRRKDYKSEIIQEQAFLTI